MTTSALSLSEQVAALRWFHSIKLAPDLTTPGVAPHDVFMAPAEIYFRDIRGSSFLDIGCWDGFYSFEAERRGAARVLATDHFAWSPRCWGTRRAFDLARETLGSRVEVQDIDLPDLSPGSVGTFDVVLFAGVFYHLRDPLQALEHVGKLARRTLIVETHVDALDVARPAMIFYPGSELNGDPTNWWGPNPPCVIAMMRDVGFAVEHLAHPVHANRAIFIGRR